MVTIDGRLFEAPTQLIGERVRLMFNEQKPHQVEVFFKGQSYGLLTPVDLGVNCTVKRDKNSGELLQTGERTSRQGLLPLLKRSDIMSYRTFFGLAKEPFAANLDLDAILITTELLGVQERLEYAMRLGAIALVTGEVGAGKSTALRWSCGQLHPSRYKILWITASAGSILEIYRQLLAELDINTASSSGRYLLA